MAQDPQDEINRKLDQERLKQQQELIKLEAKSIKAVRDSSKAVVDLSKAVAKTNVKQTELLTQKEKELERLRKKAKGDDSGLGSIFSKQRRNYEIAKLNPALAQLARSGFGDVFTQSTFQQRSLGFGKNLGGIANTQERDVMEAGIGGFMEQLTSQLKLFEGGFRTIPKELRDLTTSMRLTGQNDAKLIAALRDSVVIGGLSVEGTRDLAVTLDQTTKTYGTKTEALLEGLGSLEDMLTQNFFGITSNLDQAIVEITGQLGEGTGKMIRQFVSQITKFENLQGTTMAGINEYVNVILNSNSTTKQTKEAILAAVSKMSDLNTELAKSNTNDLRTNKVLSDRLYGVAGQLGLAINGIERRAEIDRKNQVDQRNSFVTFGKEMFTGVQRLVFDVFGSTQDSQIELLGSIDTGIKALVTIQATNAGLKAAGNLITAGKGAYSKFAGGAIGARLGLGAAAAAAESGAAGAGAAAAGGGIGLGAMAAGGAIGLAVLGAGYLAYRAYNEHEEKMRKILVDQTQKLLDEEAKRTEILTGITPVNNSPIGLGNSGDLTGMQISIQKESTQVLYDIVKELKKTNSQAFKNAKVSLGGV